MTTAEQDHPRTSLGGVVLSVAALGLVAAWMRLLDLGHAELTSAEAASAWTASQVARGLEPVALADPPTSALLFSAQVLLFWLTEATVFWARSVSAFAGSVVLVVPLLLRRSLGSWGALTLAALLAFDPGWVRASRRAEGDVLTATVLLLLVAWVVRTWHAENAFRDSTSVVVTSLSLAALISSGSLAWDALVMIALALWWWSRSSREPRGRAEVPDLAVVGRWTGGFLLVGTTTGLVQWAGPGLVSSSTTDWLQSWAQGANGGESSSTLGRGLVVVLALASLWHLAALRSARRGSDRATRVVSSVPLGLLVLWLFWGLVCAIRSGPEQAWLLASIPVFLLVALGVRSVQVLVADRPLVLPRAAVGRLTLTRLGAGCLLGAMLLVGLRAVPRSEPSAIDLLRRDLARWVSLVPAKGIVEFDWQDWPDPRVGWATLGFEDEDSEDQGDAGRGEVYRAWILSVRDQTVRLIEAPSIGSTHALRSFTYQLRAEAVPRATESQVVSNAAFGWTEAIPGNDG